MENLYETLIANLSGGVRREKLDGREFFVAPLSLIVPVTFGVLLLLLGSLCSQSVHAARLIPEESESYRPAAVALLGCDTQEVSIMPKPLQWETGVYCIENTVNGKVYVGSSGASLFGRTEGHKKALNQRCHVNRHLQAAWNKYGAGAFKFFVLERCSPAHCIEREQFWIDSYQAANTKYGYNICPKAGSCKGAKWSEASKAAVRGRPVSEETRKKLADYMAAEGRIERLQKLGCEAARVVNTGRARVFTEEHKAKIARSRTGMKLSPEHCEAISRGNTGRQPSEETRKKLSKAARNRSPETREKLRTAYFSSPDICKKRTEATVASNRERVWTDEMRAKVSKSLTGKKHSEESKAKMSLQRRGRKLSLKARRNMSKAAKLRWIKRKGGVLWNI